MPFRPLGMPQFVFNTNLCEAEAFLENMDTVNTR